MLIGREEEQKRLLKLIDSEKSDFLRETGTRSSVHITMVTPFGISRNKYSGEIRSEITAEDLFD